MSFDSPENWIDAELRRVPLPPGFVERLRATSETTDEDIDEALAAKGETAFFQHCAECHGTYGAKESYPGRIVPIDEIATDRVRLDALTPAYATTVHKAQGSEYPVVVLPLARHHGRMLRRNLVYTAITRAKRLVVLVVEGNALELAIAGRPEPRRWSKLRELLRA